MSICCRCATAAHWLICGCMASCSTPYWSTNACGARWATTGAAWWRIWKLMHTALAVQISGALCWPEQQWADGVQVMRDVRGGGRCSGSLRRSVHCRFRTVSPRPWTNLGTRNGKGDSRMNSRRYLLNLAPMLTLPPIGFSRSHSPASEGCTRGNEVAVEGSNFMLVTDGSPYRKTRMPVGVLLTGWHLWAEADSPLHTPLFGDSNPSRRTRRRMSPGFAPGASPSGPLPGPGPQRLTTRSRSAHPAW
jgi:hypothetical protein